MKFQKGYIVKFTYQENKKSPKYKGIGAYESESKTHIKFICYMLYGEDLEGVFSPNSGEFPIKCISDLDLEDPATRIKFQDTFYNMGYIYDSYNAKLYKN